MHHVWSKPTLGPTGDFITIQAGAGWQAPEGDKYKNGLLWGELSLDNKTIDLQPFTWNFSNQCWVLSGDTFHENSRIGDKWRFAAPGKLQIVDYKPKEKKNHCSVGESRVLMIY